MIAHLKSQPILILAVALTLCVALVATPAQAVIVVANPSFEANGNPNPGYGPITSWAQSGAVGTNSGAQPFLNGQTPHAGSNVAFIQNSGNISQSLSGFDPSKQYTATYFVSERGFNNGTAPEITTSVSLDGGATFFTQPDLIRRTDVFRRIVSGPLSVSGNNSTLQISAGLPAAGDRTLLVDSVSVTRAVPVVGDLGFENPVQPANTWRQQNGAGAGTLASSLWTFVSGGGITDNGSAFAPPAAPEGSQASILQNAGSSFSQTISGFEAGVSYSLSFEAAGRSGQNGANDIEVLLNGSPLLFGGLTSITPTVGAYNLFTSDDFTTAGGSFSLEFRGLGTLGGDRTTFVDDIRFNFVAEAPLTATAPEPSSLALIGLALAGLGVCRRRTR